MKKIIFVVISLGLGIVFTFFVLNKKDIYAKEEYLVFAFQVGAYEKYENAKTFSDKLPSSIIIFEQELYKVYVSFYKNIDVVNKMVVYFEDNDINIYLKTINVSKEFYNTLDNYEKIIMNTNDTQVYNKVNQSILNIYLESDKND